MNLEELRNLDLDLNRGGEWPWPARAVLMLLIFAAMVGIGYYVDTSDRLLELDEVRAKETALREEFVIKQKVVANIDAYRAQLRQLETMLAGLLRQLPTRTQMPKLLEDVSDLGRTNGLVFQQFKPLDEIPRDFYAVRPIALKATASYHQFAAFISAVSALPRIVTLENATLTAQKINDVNRDVAEPLTIEATLQAYRYLDESGTEEAIQ